MKTFLRIAAITVSVAILTSAVAQAGMKIMWAGTDILMAAGMDAGAGAYQEQHPQIEPEAINGTPGLTIHCTNGETFRLTR